MTVHKIDSLPGLHHIIDNLETVVVDFSAPGWCVPCRRLQPHFEAAAARLPNITFVEVDIDQSPEIRDQYDIMSVPFVVRFDRGQLTGPVQARTLIQFQKELTS